MFKWIKNLFRRPASTPVRRMPLGLEAFEDRMVPSATVALGAISHILTINGTAASDQIEISPPGSGIQVDVNGRTQSYSSGSVRQIVVNGGAGNDLIVNDTSLPFTANGGAGNDTLIGDGGEDYLNGGAGNDVVVGGQGLNVLQGSAGVNDGNGSGFAVDLLSATLSGTTGESGKITLLLDGTSLRVDVSGLTAEATYTVEVAGSTVGTFTTDSGGSANITLSGISAAIASGTSVSIVDSAGITDLSGSFAGGTLPPPPGPVGNSGMGSLLASLSSSTSGESGEITALPAQTSGEYNIQVSVTGLTPDTTYTVQIAGTSIGTFTTDSTGAANITFNDIASTIASGTAVSIVDSSGTTELSGTFSSPSLPPPPTCPGGIATTHYNTVACIVTEAV